MDEGFRSVRHGSSLPAASEMFGPPRTGPVVLVPRRIPGGVTASLDGLPEQALPRLWFEGPVPALRPRLRAAFAERLSRPRWLANWLFADVLDNVALLEELAGAAPIRVALGASCDAAGGGFMVAEARFRLVVTYRGAGLEWLTPRFSAGSSDHATSGEALRGPPRGDVVILRGGAGGDGAGVAHRFRPEMDLVPLRLTVDALEPQRRRRPSRKMH